MLAMNLNNNKIQTDRELFDPNTLSNYPDISEWMTDPEGAHAERFANMSIKAFKEYKRNADEMRKGKGKGKVSEGKGKESVGKKRAVRYEDDDNEDDDNGKHRPKKTKSKRKAGGYDSDKLDG